MEWRSWLAAALLLISTAASAVDPRLDWRTLTSEHFELHYPAQHAELARRALAVAEGVHTRLSRELGWQPRGRTQVVLSDDFDFANGAATPIPFNTIKLYAVPPDDLRALTDFDDWLTQLITHEYTHTLHLDRAGGAPLALRSVFGRQFLLFPNALQPAFLIEGLATYRETDGDRGLGRGQSALYRMYMRGEVLGGVKPFDRVAMSGATTWPGGQMPYLYGVHFYQFLEERYGRAAADRLIAQYSRQLVPFMVNRGFANAVGRGTPALWGEFASWLRARYQPEIAAIREAGVVEGERLTRHGFNTDSLSALPDGRVFYVREVPDKPITLMEWRPGAGVREVAELRFGARIDAHPRAGVLIAQPEVCENYNVYFDLYRVDPASGDRDRLTRCGRYRDAVWAQNGERIAAVRMDADRARLDWLDAQGQRRDTLWEGAPGEIVTGLAVAPDGASLAATVWRPGRGWNLERFDLAAKRWQPLTADAALDAEPSFSADGQSLLYTSDHGGVFNLRRLDLKTGQTVTLTQVLGGAFQPVQAGGDIYYLGYTSAGFDLYRLPAAAEPRATPASRRPAHAVPPEYPAVATAESDYSPWSTLAPTSWLPWLSAGPDQIEIGASVFGRDALDIHGYDAFLAYEAEHGNWLGAASYRYDFIGVGVARGYDYTHADDQLRRIRQVDAWEARWMLPRLGLDRSLALHLGIGGVTERDEFRAAGVAPEADERERYAGAAFTLYDALTLERSVSPNHGRDVRLVATTNNLLNGTYTGNVATLDWREYLPLGGEHVLALRVVQGWGSQRPRPFQLGGVAAAADAFEDLLLFNRRDYALRGYPEGLAALEGRRMQLLTVDYRFPIVRVERGFTRFPLGVQQLSGRFFTDTGAAWDRGGLPDDYRTGVGSEFVADLNLFYLANVRARLGVAQGLNDDGEPQVYLLIGAAL